jgi:hypothetical protein
MLVNLIWAFGGDGNWKARKALSDFVRASTAIQLPPNNAVCLFIDFSPVFYLFINFSFQ